jgi:hypothetical protein
MTQRKRKSKSKRRKTSSSPNHKSIELCRVVRSFLLPFQMIFFAVWAHDRTSQNPSFSITYEFVAASACIGPITVKELMFVAAVAS